MSIGRLGHEQFVGFLRKTINYNDANIATGIKMGTLPVGGHVIQTSVHIRTAINGGALTVGTNGAAYDNLINGAAVTEATLGYTVAPPNADIVYPTGDLDVLVKLTAGASAGVADIVVMFVYDDQLYV